MGLVPMGQAPAAGCGAYTMTLESDEHKSMGHRDFTSPSSIEPRNLAHTKSNCFSQSQSPSRIVECAALPHNHDDEKCCFFLVGQS